MAERLSFLLTQDGLSPASAPGWPGTGTDPISMLGPRPIQGLSLQTKAAALSWDDEAWSPSLTDSNYPLQTSSEVTLFKISRVAQLVALAFMKLSGQELPTDTWLFILIRVIACTSAEWQGFSSHLGNLSLQVLFLSHWPPNARPGANATQLQQNHLARSSKIQIPSPSSGDFDSLGQRWNPGSHTSQVRIY